MASLFDDLQAFTAGGQAGNAAAGMIPNAMQPTGSPQLYTQAIGQMRKIVDMLNQTQAQLLRDAGTDDVMQGAVKEIMGCTHKLQGVSTQLADHLKDIAMSQAQNQMMQQPQAAEAQAPMMQQPSY